MAEKLFHRGEEEQPEGSPAPVLDEYHAYRCSYCGAVNEIFADASATWLFEPGGTQRQHLTEECLGCGERNLVALTVARDGSLTIDAQPSSAD